MDRDKKKYPKLKLHMIGKLQTNKVKFAVQIFDYIHSVDSEKLAKKIADEQNKINKKIKIFLQVNIGDENQKSGINKNNVKQLVNYCKEIGLDLIGLMCIPPADIDPVGYFEEMNKLNENLNFSDLSMGCPQIFLKLQNIIQHILELDLVFLVKDPNKFLFLNFF